METLARHRVLPVPQALADADLVARVRHGEAAAFELLMRRYNSRLFRIARAILRDDGEAEDAVQEGYVCAWFKLAQLREPGGFAAWLSRIVAHEALMRRRRLQRMQFATTGSAHDSRVGPLRLAELQDRARGPAAQAHEAQLRELLETAIDRLPDVYRDAFVFREVEQMSVAETACCLGIGEAAVKTRVHRARKLLQRNLADGFLAALRGTFDFDGARCDRLVALVMLRIGGSISDRGSSSSPAGDVRP